MVYNMFLLNLRLDPGIFDPFSGEIQHPAQTVPCCQEPESCYELAEDCLVVKEVNSASSGRSFTHDAYDLADNSVQVPGQDMIISNASCSSCLTCLRCGPPYDPFAGSSSHVCHNTGEAILDEHCADQCPHYVPGQTSSEIEY